MKKYLLPFMFLLAVQLNAQTVNIDWRGTKEYSNGEGYNLNLPFFENKGYNVFNGIPYFIYTEPIQSMANISLANVTFSNLTPTERGNLNVAEIPEKLEYSAKVDEGLNGLKLTVGMFPFVKENGQIRKVNSFQIVKQQALPAMAVNNVYDPATQSVLKSGSWYKIKVNKSGVFRLDKSFFDQNNIPTNFDPRTLKIYGNGGRMLNENPGDFRYGALQENAIKFVGEEDGNFDSSDYILFYAQGPHGWNRLDTSDLSNLTHRFHQYSDYAYYFITYGNEPGKRIQDSNISDAAVQTFNQYDEYQFYELDSLSVNMTGRQWVGESFKVNPTQTFTLKGGGPVAGELHTRYRLVGKNAAGVSYTVSLNGVTAPGSTFLAGDFSASYVNTSLSGLTGNTFNFNITVNDSSNPNSFVFLDYIELVYRASLSFNGSQMHFRRLENLNDGNTYGFSLSGGATVWNISDHTTALNVQSSGNVYKYKSNSPFFRNEFIAFTESAAYTDVEYVGTVANQDIRSLSQIDYAIVVHPNYLSEAVRLANFRIQNDGLKVAVVTTDQVYNDFSSGAQDVSAIRDFFKHLRDTGSPLRNVMLFGGASFDYKDRIADNSNFVPAFISFNSASLDTSFVTDDYFTMLDDSDIIKLNPASPGEWMLSGAGQMDIGVGRFPAHNMAEAKTMVDKTLAFYEKLPGQGTSFGDWKTRFLLVVDDDKGANFPFHVTVENSSGVFIESNIPYSTLRKGYLDSFPMQQTSAGPRYPQVNQLIGNAFNLGSALIVYFGHGGMRSWSQTRVITYEEINSFNNFSGLYSRLPVVMTITCEFTVWDLPHLPSAGVYMFKAAQGGASAMVTTSRPVFVSYGEQFNGTIMEELLKVVGNKYQNLGEALTIAKSGNLSSSVNHINVNLLGDPLLSVPRPPRNIRITKINGEDADTFDGVLRALDFVEIEGEVLDESGTMRDNSFNGKATANLFDKPENRVTLNNMRNGDMGVMNYKEQVNAIFKGGTNVEYGKFKFQFYIPKDINYEIGEGKITIYAHNNVIDGVTTKKIKVGDQNPDGLDDDNGPSIGLYMNNLNFVDGGITDRNPYLLACLVDESGINTSGIAIGHDITAVLDQDVEGTLVLNEYYEGGDNNPCTNPQVLDYQKGQVTYRLNNLELGNHQVVFKAWDINNNSSTQSLDFVVMEEGSEYIYIEKLLNWPNPFTNRTFFQFEHNCDSELDVMVQIYTISGKLVKTIRQPVSAEPWREGYRTGRFAIPWDGLDDFGDKIGKGVYIYRLSARGINPEECKGSATAIEKLVILK
jgi:hypothetical protein